MRLTLYLIFVFVQVFTTEKFVVTYAHIQTHSQSKLRIIHCLYTSFKHWSVELYI